MLLVSRIKEAVLVVGEKRKSRSFWNSVLRFLKESVSCAKDILEKEVVSAKVFIVRIAENVSVISKVYARTEDQWEEITTKKPVDTYEVPKEILEKTALGEEVDITDELEMRLQSA